MEVQFINKSDDFMRVIIPDAVLMTALGYALETNVSVLEDKPDDPIAQELQEQMLGIIRFKTDPWDYANQPKCILCNRLLNNRETTGKCLFCERLHPTALKVRVIQFMLENIDAYRDLTGEISQALMAEDAAAHFDYNAKEPPDVFLQWSKETIELVMETPVHPGTDGTARSIGPLPDPEVPTTPQGDDHPVAPIVEARDTWTTPFSPLWG